MHAYLADGFHEAWLANLGRARRELSPGTICYPGHGDPGPAAALIDWQETYIHTFIDAVRTAAGDTALDDDAFKDVVTARMKAFLPSDDLLFLMQLSIAPQRSRLVRRTND
jgi:glyoxylase-like metal-dependent hydrolase (beta-lactamase superfamily II)